MTAGAQASAEVPQTGVDVAANLAAIEARIAAAALAAARPPELVTLVAVAKTHPPESCGGRWRLATACSARTGCRRRRRSGRL